jgi:hypothetical protein
MHAPTDGRTELITLGIHRDQSVAVDNKPAIIILDAELPYIIVNRDPWCNG